MDGVQVSKKSYCAVLVRVWPLADIGFCAAHMSTFDPKRTMGLAPHPTTVAEEGRAILPWCARPIYCQVSGDGYENLGYLCFRISVRRNVCLGSLGANKNWRR